MSAHKTSDAMSRPALGPLAALAVVVATQANLVSAQELFATDQAARIKAIMLVTDLDETVDRGIGHDRCVGSDSCCLPSGNRRQSRSTLMQWSHRTNDSGGTDLDEPLVTDRPDFTEASSTVGLGVAQLEVGYTYTFDDDGTSSTHSHSYSEPLLRYGILAEWLELRVGWNSGSIPPAPTGRKRSTISMVA